MDGKQGYQPRCSNPIQREVCTESKRCTIKGHYIGTVDSYMLDSLNLGPYPAAMAGFVVATDEGDTLVHKQMIIMDGKDLYYLNNTFDWNDDGTLKKKGDSVLSSFRIASPKTYDK